MADITLEEARQTFREGVPMKMRGVGFALCDGVDALLARAEAAEAERDAAELDRQGLLLIRNFNAACLERAEAERDELREMLRRVEWVKDETEPGMHYEFCPVCEVAPGGNRTGRPTAHFPGCELAALLDGAP